MLRSMDSFKCAKKRKMFKVNKQSVKGTCSITTIRINSTIISGSPHHRINYKVDLISAKHLYDSPSRLSM